MADPSYNRAQAKRALAEFRAKRRSATPDGVADLCKALGYTVNLSRGKGSHAVASRAGAPPIVIPKHIGLRIATNVLTTLEEVFERDGSNENGKS